MTKTKRDRFCPYCAIRAPRPDFNYSRRTMNASLEHLTALQSRQDRIRNLCVMAHVDHGKTSLSDHLIGSNGLIHPKLQVSIQCHVMA